MKRDTLITTSTSLDANEVMSGLTEVLAYGTAVVVEEIYK